MKSDLHTRIGIDWLNTLEAEQLVLGLLGKALFDFPEREWLELLAKDAVFDDIPFAAEVPDVKAGMKLLKEWNDKNKEGLSDEAFELIKDDYTRLFIGPGAVLAPPWESIYFHQERVIFQKQTLEVREWYCRFGLESVKLYNEPDDHIGLELAFVSHLAGLAYAVFEQKEQEKFEQLIAAQKQFLSEHTLQWAAGWSKLVVEHTRTDFFRGIALITRGVLTELAYILDL